MRVGTQATARLQLAAEVFQLLCWNAAFEVGAGINAGSGVTLKINEVAVAAFSLRLKEMVESNFI